jgi:hypothetical protein
MLTPYPATIPALVPFLAGCLAGAYDTKVSVVLQGRASGHAWLVTPRVAVSVLALYAEPGPGQKPYFHKVEPPAGAAGCALVAYPPSRPNWQSTIAVDGMAVFPDSDEPLRLSHGAMLLDGPRLWIVASDGDAALLIDDAGIHRRSQDDVPGMRSVPSALGRPWWRGPDGG